MTAQLERLYEMAKEVDDAAYLLACGDPRGDLDELLLKTAALRRACLEALVGREKVA